MNNANSENKVAIPMFDGDRDNFQLWWVRFEAYGLVKGFSPALSKTREADLPRDGRDELDVTEPAGKRAKAAITRNNLAIASMTMAFTTSGLINKVYKARTTEYPGGLAHLLVADLLKECQPKDRISKVEAKVKLLDIKMKSGGDPKEIFEQISKVENEHNDDTRTLDKDDLIAVVLHATEENCVSVLTSEMRQKGDAVTMDDLKEAMDQHYRLMSQTTNESNELGLVSTCYDCGEEGHQKKNCPKLKNNRRRNNNNDEKQKGKFKGTCFHCGKAGHKKENCWELDKNSSKRPE